MWSLFLLVSSATRHLSRCDKRSEILFSPWWHLWSTTGNLTVADVGEGPVGPGPTLFFDQTEAQSAKKKNFLETAPPSPPLPSPLLSPLPTYLKVWIRHCFSDDDDDCSENVAEKMNLRSFIGNFSWSWILKNIIQVSKEKGKLVVVCSCPP